MSEVKVTIRCAGCKSLAVSTHSGIYKNNIVYYCKCHDCSCESDLYATLKEAIAEWIDK